MEKITTIGVDLAKSVFQVHGVDAAGRVVLTKALRRREVQPFFERLAPGSVSLAERSRKTPTLHAFRQ